MTLSGTSYLYLDNKQILKGHLQISLDCIFGMARPGGMLNADVDVDVF